MNRWVIAPKVIRAYSSNSLALNIDGIGTHYRPPAQIRLFRIVPLTTPGPLVLSILSERVSARSGACPTSIRPHQIVSEPYWSVDWARYDTRWTEVCELYKLIRRGRSRSAPVSEKSQTLICCEAEIHRLLQVVIAAFKFILRWFSALQFSGLPSAISMLWSPMRWDNVPHLRNDTAFKSELCGLKVTDHSATLRTESRSHSGSKFLQAVHLWRRIRTRGRAERVRGLSNGAPSVHRRRCSPDVSAAASHCFC